MKKHFVVFLAVCCLLTLLRAAGADLIIVPQHSEHDNDVSIKPGIGEHGYGRYYMNSSGESISVKKEPGSEEAVAAIETNGRVFIGWTRSHEGEDWGKITGFSNWVIDYSAWRNGWVPMNQFTLMYDEISFDEEHEDEYYFYPLSGEELSKIYYETVAWRWPGSGEKALSNASHLDISEDFLSRNNAYRDAQGRIWYRMPHYRWVCLSDPINDAIPAFNPSRPVGLDAAESKTPAPMLTIILVTALAAVTAVLIWVIWKPRLK